MHYKAFCPECDTSNRGFCTKCHTRSISIYRNIRVAKKIDPITRDMVTSSMCGGVLYSGSIEECVRLIAYIDKNYSSKSHDLGSRLNTIGDVLKSLNAKINKIQIDEDKKVEVNQYLYKNHEHYQYQRFGSGDGNISIVKDIDMFVKLKAHYLFQDGAWVADCQFIYKELDIDNNSIKSCFIPRKFNPVYKSGSVSISSSYPKLYGGGTIPKVIGVDSILCFDTKLDAKIFCNMVATLYINYPKVFCNEDIKKVALNCIKEGNTLLKHYPELLI